MSGRPEDRTALLDAYFRAARPLATAGSATRALTRRRLLETLRSRDRSTARWHVGRPLSRLALLAGLVLASGTVGAVLHRTVTTSIAPSSRAPVRATSGGSATSATSVSSTPAGLPEHAVLMDAMSKLYRDRDAAAALAALEAHRRIAVRVLDPEAIGIRIDALLALGRRREALAILDRQDLSRLPRPGERRVLRGELRAEQGRCDEAMADFDAILAVGRADAAAERALRGRASCAPRGADRAGSPLRKARP